MIDAAGGTEQGELREADREVEKGLILNSKQISLAKKGRKWKAKGQRDGVGLG